MSGYLLLSQGSFLWTNPSILAETFTIKCVGILYFFKKYTTVGVIIRWLSIFYHASLHEGRDFSPTIITEAAIY